MGRYVEYTLWRTMTDETPGEIKGLGGYSEYVFADEKICFKVPKTTGNNAAATVPLACATAWLALFSKGCLNIQRGTENPTPVLIWGGSCKTEAST